MYDELVKRLREPCQYENCILCQQAADAIEDLEFACNRYEKDYKALCKYLPKWIPVTERLPEPGQDVLVALGRGEIAIDYYQPDRWGYRDVTHWMPLPEPPKEES